jgi:hypothetical protein
MAKGPTNTANASVTAAAGLSYDAFMNLLRSDPQGLDAYFGKLDSV